MAGQLEGVKAQAIAASHLEQAFQNLLRAALTSHLALKLPDPTTNAAPAAPLPTPPAPQSPPPMPVVGGAGGQPTPPVYPPAPPPPPSPLQLVTQQYQPQQAAMQQALHNAVAGIPGVGFRV